MAHEPSAVFLDRPEGVSATPVGDSIARPELAIRAVLQTADGGVLVKSIERQPDGSFVGEVYGVTPKQRRVAVGDRVSFTESQMFTFKTPDAPDLNAADAEMAEMIRAFSARFGDAEPPNAEQRASAALGPSDFSFEPRTPETPAAPPPSAGGPELSIADASAILGASAPATRESQRAHAEPVAPAQAVVPRAPPPPPPHRPTVTPPRADQALRADPVPRADKPVAPTTPPPDERPLPSDSTPAAAAAVPADQPIACLECGATLTVVTTADGARPAKVSCGSCGRINDVAAAEAASRRRRSFGSA